MGAVDLLLAWPLPGARPLGAQLVASYGHPDRRYHDGRHLAEVLERVHELSAHGVEFDRMAVLLAAWFHDSVYDAQPDAEKRSAAWAAEALPTLVDQAVVDEVVRLVLMTEHHLPADDDANGCALSDADLAILAAPAERYAEYAASVREEYADRPGRRLRRRAGGDPARPARQAAPLPHGVRPRRLGGRRPGQRPGGAGDAGAVG